MRRRIIIHRPGIYRWWEIDFECRPLPHLAINPNPPVALLNDPVDGCKPDARTLASRLRGKERLKRVCPCRLVHPHAAIAEGEHDVAAQFRLRVGRSVVLVDASARARTDPGVLSKNDPGGL